MPREVHAETFARCSQREDHRMHRTSGCSVEAAERAAKRQTAAMEKATVSAPSEVPATYRQAPLDPVTSSQRAALEVARRHAKAAAAAAAGTRVGTSLQARSLPDGLRRQSGNSLVDDAPATPVGGVPRQVCGAHSARCF